MKGIFYSLITLLFVAPLVVLSVSYLNYAKDTTGKAFGDSLAAYSRSVEDDLPMASYIMAKRALGSAVMYVDIRGMPLDDAEFRLRELMINGTIYGNATDQNFTLNSWIYQLREKGKLYGMDPDVQLISLSIAPKDSYTLKVNVRILVNTSLSTMRLERVYDSAIDVSIEGLLDPLYTLKTNGILKRQITKPNITVYGAQNLDYAVSRKFYTPSDSGPSFLDRLEGRLYISSRYQNLTNIGLETIVSLPELQSNGLSVKTSQSDVDYLYFDSDTHLGQPVVNSTYLWLRLDTWHAAKYGVSLE